MPEVIEKAELLDNIQVEYNRLESLLLPLSEEQMTIPQVNGPWSIKDNIAHLAAWQGYLLNQLQGVLDGEEPPEFMPGLSTEDEINEHFYQENKDRPLADVFATFRTLYQSVVETIQAMSEETLNAPLPWRKDDNPIWPLIAGNTYEHYQEHGNIIRSWLSSSQ